MENRKHQVAGNSGRTCRVRCTRSWMRWIQHPQMMQMINVPKAGKPLAALVMSLYSLFLSKRWCWWGPLLTWSLMGPCVCFFFWVFVVDLSRSEDVFWFVQLRKKWCTLKNKTSPKKTTKTTAGKLAGDVVGKMIWFQLPIFQNQLLSGVNTQEKASKGWFYQNYLRFIVSTYRKMAAM